MKLEPTFQNEKCTVSWHADSTLEHYSSIAVYHCTRDKKIKATEKEIAQLRKNKKSDQREKKKISKNIEKSEIDEGQSGISASSMDLGSSTSADKNVRAEDEKKVDDEGDKTVNELRGKTPRSEQKDHKNQEKQKDQKDRKAEEVDDSWRISLRVCPNAEGPKAGKLKTGTGYDMGNDSCHIYISKIDLHIA